MKITFVQANGTRSTVEAEVGDSVMQTALNNDIDGVLAECGGAMMCATCHCYVEAPWAEITGTRRDGEDEMLDCAADEVTPLSRLSCQIKLTPDMDGLVVRLPQAQA